jgi:hypothetical protein
LVHARSPSAIIVPDAMPCAQHRGFVGAAERIAVGTLEVAWCVKCNPVLVGVARLIASECWDSRPRRQADCQNAQ